MIPIDLHSSLYSPDETFEDLLLIHKFSRIFSLYFLPILFHPLVKIFGRDYVFVLPAFVEEGGLETCQIVLERDRAFLVLLADQPNHHKFSVEILSRTHHLDFLSFLHPNLVQFQDLRHEVACNLPGRISI
jgi:hypothetical protein